MLGINGNLAKTTCGYEGTIIEFPEIVYVACSPVIIAICVSIVNCILVIALVTLMVLTEMLVFKSAV